MADELRETRSWWRSHSGLTLLGFLVIAGFYLVSEHRAHLFGASLAPASRLQRLLGI